ncbi:hypothetical protein ZWY2020_011069 [Hordeum vulgare]|nr:hypothetical protein ZWY2020_011069 [Hordeum vulgare]
MDCWEALVDEWCTGSWRAVQENAKDRRSQMAHHNKTEMPHLYDLYGMAHTASYKKAKEFYESHLDDPYNFTNISSHHKLVTYRDTGKATKGDDFNPSQEPLDPELVMISGGGRPHGSIAIGDGIICCPLNLPEIKACQLSSCPEIKHRPRPVDLAIETTKKLIPIVILDISTNGVEAALDVLGLLVKPGLLCNSNSSSVVTEQSH